MTKPKPIRPRDLRPLPVAAAINAAVWQFIPARVAVVDDPLSEISDRDFSNVPAFATIASLAPKTSAAFVCSVNGQYIPRKEWSTLVRSGETIIFQVLPGKVPGGGGSNPLRMVLQLALVVGVAWLVGPVLGLTGLTASLASAGLMIVGSLLINALVPLPKAQDSNAAAGASPTYSIALQGNSARMDGSKPVGYGLQQQFPDFAIQPYQAYIGNEQYYYCVLMIGLGRYEIKKVMIDDTPITNFSEVDMHIVGPGLGSIYNQSLVDLNMITSPEVSGQELRDTSAWIGPFIACRPGHKITKIFAELSAPRGVGYANDDGSLAWRSIVFQAQAQEVDDFGNAVGAWIDVVNPTTNANYAAAAPAGAGTATAVQMSCEFLMPDEKRYQFRMRRVTPYVDSTRDLCELVWVGMRARIVKNGIVEKADPEGTYLLLRIRASKQLSGMSQRKISVVWERKIPYYDGTNWIWVHDGPHHRNPAWAIADMLRNPVYSIGLPMSRIDIASIMSLAAICAERQDRFDYIFDTRTTIWDALALAARCARAVNIVRRGNYSFVRDSAQTLPVAMYTPRSMSKDSLTIRHDMPQDTTPDAIRLKYRDGRFWDERVVVGQYYNDKVHTYLEGVRPTGVPPPALVADVPFAGISGFHHASRESAYIMAVSRWRRSTYLFGTDLNGLLPSYGSLIGLSHDLPGFGQSAEVDFYDESTRKLVASQALVWTAGAQHYVRLGKRTGGLTDPIPVTKGATDDTMTLATAPGFSVVGYNDADMTIPTQLAFGVENKQFELLLLKGIKPKGENSIDMTAIIEDERVHLADADHLPVGGGQLDVYAYGTFQNAVMPAVNAVA